jgi:hypothetical protein
MAIEGIVPLATLVWELLRYVIPKRLPEPLRRHHTAMEKLITSLFES